MISATDVPPCPACGSREVHPVKGRDDQTLYACRQCGRDNTDAWRGITPKPKMKPLTPAAAAAEFDRLNPHSLGIGAKAET